jgi:hypothetical protein
MVAWRAHRLATVTTESTMAQQAQVVAQGTAVQFELVETELLVSYLFE